MIRFFSTEIGRNIYISFPRQQCLCERATILWIHLHCVYCW